MEPFLGRTRYMKAATSATTNACNASACHCNREHQVSPVGAVHTTLRYAIL